MTSFLELLPGYKKSTLTFLVMPHGLVHESEEKLRAHFLHTGTPSATGLNSPHAKYRAGYNLWDSKHGILTEKNTTVRSLRYVSGNVTCCEAAQ